MRDSINEMEPTDIATMDLFSNHRSGVLGNLVFLLKSWVPIRTYCAEGLATPSACLKVLGLLVPWGWGSTAAKVPNSKLHNYHP
jgi:hypothetical protein